MFDFLILIIKNEVLKFNDSTYRSTSKVNTCICNEYKKYLLGILLLIFLCMNKKSILSTDDIVSPPPHAKIPPGRHDARGMDQRHMPCHLTKSYKPQLKPLKRKIMERAREMHKAVVTQDTDVSSVDSFFMTEVSGASSDIAKAEDVQQVVPKEKKQVKSTKGVKKRSPRKTASNQSSIDTERETQQAWERFCKETYDWDAYTLSRVSSHMAKWVVLEKMPEGEERDRLKKLVEAWYGRQDSSDLLLESLGELKKEETVDKKEKDEKKPQKKWKKPESTYVY